MIRKFVERIMPKVRMAISIALNPDEEWAPPVAPAFMTVLGEVLPTKPLARPMQKKTVVTS